MIGFHTITEGDRIAIWDRQGRHTVISGPRRLFLYRKRRNRLCQ